MEPNQSVSDRVLSATNSRCIEQRSYSTPSVIVIGGGISGVAAARFLANASFKVLLLESRDRLGGRIHTDYSFGCPVDMGASWLHGVCNENPLAPLIRCLGLKLYRTSGDNSVLYDHDLESCSLFNKDGQPIPQQMVVEVGEIFKRILKETEKVREDHSGDMSVLQAISIVLDRHPHLRQEGLAHEVLQWYLCRMEAWFAADADMISLKTWDQEKFEKYKADHCSSQGSIGNSSTNVDAGDEVQQPAKSDFEIWKEAVGLTKRGQLHGLGPMGTAEIKGSSLGGSTSKKFLSWKEDPEFQEYLNSRLEEERSEKERLKRELDQYMKKTNKLGKIMKTLIKQFGGSVSEILSDNEE